MYADVQIALSKLSRMSRPEADAFFQDLATQSRNDLVKLQWTLTYDEQGRDILSVADVALVNRSDALLQIWLRNAAAGIWVPELQPWEVSVVEFKPAQSITSARLGLLDSKWSKDDIGRKYRYQVWGFLLHNTKVESFALEKWAVYPGDA